MVADVTSFTVNFSQRRDVSFFSCGEICRLTHKLCFRCYTPDTAPLEKAWFVLLGFRTSEGTYTDADEFLIRRKLTNGVNIAGKQKARGINSGTGASHALIQKKTETEKADFVTCALHYLGYLLDELLRQSGLHSDIVKRLAAFDPLILFTRPTEVVLRHFEALFTAFLLRTWVTNADDPAYRYEYLELWDHLRTTYPPDFILEESSRDLIDFLMGLDFVQPRARLLYLFKLCCLCITAPSPQIPAITIWSLSTANLRGQFTDVPLPCQSCVSGVSDSVSHCSSDDSMAKFSLLSVDFGQTALSDDYGPWTFVDTLARSRIYKSLLTSHKTACTGTAVSVKMTEGAKASSSVDKSALEVPTQRKRKLSGSVATKSTTSSEDGSSIRRSSKQ